MNKSLSIYLDLVRSCAAIVVFLGHAGMQSISGGLSYRFQRYGEPAVDIFFVLSGFVICFVTSTREGSPFHYSVNRLARVYSVALPAVVLSIVLDQLCRLVAPHQYVAFPEYLITSTWRSDALALVFSNHNWFGWAQPGMDGPYWSLSFEVWYYIAFGFAVFTAGYIRLAAIACIAILVGPKICLLAPVWLLGVLCFRMCNRMRLDPMAGLVLAILPPILFFGWYAGTADGRVDYPYAELSLTWAWVWNTRFDLIVGILFAIHLFGMSSAAPLFAKALDSLARPIRFVAGASFTIYLMHFPLLYFVAAASPWAAGDWRTRCLVFFAVPATLFLLAEVTEKRKGDWRRVFSWALTAAASAARPGRMAPSPVSTGSPSGAGE